MSKLLRLRLLLAAVLALSFSHAQGENKPATNETQFDAILVWGSDGGKPEGKDLKELDAGFAERLRSMLKWQNYYEVKREPVKVRAGQPIKHLKLSEKCSIKVNYNERNGLEVELFGEGKFVARVKQAMPLSDILVLAGNDKNATAWFVVLQPRNP